MICLCKKTIVYTKIIVFWNWIFAKLRTYLLDKTRSRLFLGIFIMTTQWSPLDADWSIYSRSLSIWWLLTFRNEVFVLYISYKWICVYIIKIERPLFILSCVFSHIFIQLKENLYRAMSSLFSESKQKTGTNFFELKIQILEKK